MSLPVFTPRAVNTARDRWNRPIEPVDVWPPCVACGAGEPQVDAASGTCRACWRFVVLLPAVLRAEEPRHEGPGVDGVTFMGAIRRAREEMARHGITSIVDEPPKIGPVRRRT